MKIRRHYVACLLFVSWLSIGAAAEAAHPAATPQRPPAPAAPVAAPQPQSAQPMIPTPPQIDVAEITKRANQEVGSDIHATVTGWKRELDRVEGDLERSNLRYVELNNLRDELQHLRAGVDDFSDHVTPRLEAVKAELELLGPAPTKDQPPEAEQLAQRRAELNFHSGLLSEGQSAVSAAHLRIEHLTNAIQDSAAKKFHDETVPARAGSLFRQNLG